MAKKNKPDKLGFVYSTDPQFRFEFEDTAARQTLPAAQQKLRLRLDTKQRGGKSVTLVQGFVGGEEDIERLGKTLKNYCGTGGSVKNAEIIIQGDQRDKILQWLLKNGYAQSKRL